MPVDYKHANASYLPGRFKYPHLFERVYLGAYYPPFLERLVEARARAAERGYHYFSIFGWRSWAEQFRLRQAYLTGKGGKAAPAGDSAHQYGLADDCVRDLDTAAPGLQLGKNGEAWNAKHYEVWIQELARVGLASGVAYNDRPHANWPGFESRAQLAPLRSIWTNAGAKTPDEVRLRACWAYLDVLPLPGVP